MQKLPFASGKAVFTEITNYTDWGMGVAVPYSWFSVFWVNSAWMVPVYMAEETHKASTETPRSILYTWTLTAVSGLVFYLISAFCITDISAMGLDPTLVPTYTTWRPRLIILLGDILYMIS